MKNSPFFCWLMLGFSMIFAQSGAALTLAEAFLAAKQNTAGLNNKILAEELAMEQRSLAIAALGPTLEVSSNSLWRDEVGGSSVTSSFGEGHQHTGLLTLNQPLFKGGGEYFLLKAAKLSPRVAEFERIQFEIDLFTELARQFYGVLSLEEEQKTLLDQQRLLEQRVSYLRSRVKIGRTRRAELLAGESQKEKVLAELESLASRKLLAKEKLSELTGISEITSLFDPLSTSKWESQVHQYSPEETKSPRIQAAELVVEQARLATKGSKGDYLPSLDLTGNYYLDRAGVLADSKWDVSLVAKWELYSGGETLSAVKSSSILAEQLAAEFKDLQRNEKARGLRLKAQLQLKLDEMTKLKKAVEYSELSYKENIRESQVGLVSDLEVLRSLDDYLQIKKSYDRIQFEPKVIYFEWLSAIGVKP